MKPPPLHIDRETLHRLWSALPQSRCEKSFWIAMEAFCDTFLSEHCPLRDQEFFAVPHSGRVMADELHFIDPNLLERCNELRDLYNAFTLWNPLQFAALFKMPINIVIEQFFLAVESKWLKLDFVLSCRSCACDILHFKSVNEIRFTAGYHSSGGIACPVCSDVTEIKELNDVSVFFILDRLHPVFSRLHHRLYRTAEASQRRLESYFCPAGAGLAINIKLPKGGFLLCAPFMGAMAHLNVEVDGELLNSRDHYLPRIIDLKKYVAQTEAKPPAPQKGRRKSLAKRETDVDGGDRSTASTHFDMNYVPQTVHTLTLAHGKLQLRIFNESPHSGFIDLYVAFDPRVEFSAVEYPKQLRVPDLLHHLPRGLRSNYVLTCVPRPPSTTLTSGVFCRHIFDLDPESYDDPSVISVLREVHRYSLEDHHGLLLGMGNGGISFDSSFLTLTAALASSVCFLQRVLVRLEVNVALKMRCSITEGPLKVASYQGQYNDTDNMRSSYPDVQFVGPVIYCSTHPEIKAPIVVESSNQLRRNEFDSFTDLFSNQASPSRSEQKKHTMLRFEIRSVPEDSSFCYGSVPLCDSYVEKSNDKVFPYFLNYLCEHFEGTEVEEEGHALVVQMPLPILYASVQMSTVLDSSSYSKEVVGPF